MEHEEAFKLFLDTWGQESQERMAIEEMSELIKALCKIQRKRRVAGVSEEELAKLKQDVQEETADVLNLMEQMKCCYGSEEIEKIQDEKIKRELKRSFGK